MFFLLRIFIGPLLRIGIVLIVAALGLDLAGVDVGEMLIRWLTDQISWSRLTMIETNL